MNNTSYIRSSMLAALASSLFTAILVLGFQAVADQDSSTDSVPRLVPYNGTLSFDGVPMTLTGDDAPWLRFDIFDNEPLDGVDPEVPVYSQSMLVDVYAGKFTAMLGPSDDNGVSILEIVSDADSLALKITILGDHDENNPESTAADDVTLSNTQRLVFSPFAMWATNATDFNVANTLTAPTVTVTTSLLVDGSISSNEGDVTVSDNLAVEEGNIILGIDSTITSDVGDVTVSDNLAVEGGNIILGTDSTITSTEDIVTIDADLEIGNSISSSLGIVIASDPIHSLANISSATNIAATGNLSAGGNLTVAGTILSAGDTLTINDDLDVTGTVDLNLSRYSCTSNSGAGSCSTSSNVNYLDCPTGQQLIAGGGRCNVQNYHLRYSYPSSLSRWSVFCENTQGDPRPDQTTVYIVCADIE